MPNRSPVRIAATAGENRVRRPRRIGPRNSASSQIAGVSAMSRRVRSGPRPPPFAGAIAWRKLSTSSFGAGRIHSATRPTTSQAESPINIAPPSARRRTGRGDGAPRPPSARARARRARSGRRGRPTATARARARGARPAGERRRKSRSTQAIAVERQRLAGRRWLVGRRRRLGRCRPRPLTTCRSQAPSPRPASSVKNSRSES